MSFLDFITGGANQNAQADLDKTLAAINAIKTPTSQELQLSPLDQYYATGELSPALAQAAETGPSAYDSENLSSVPFETMQKVLAQQDQIASSNGMTPQEQAAIARDEADVNRNTAGQRGAIAADFAQRGVPQSLIAAALENGTAGSNAQTAYEGALTARANAANTAETARTNEGALAGQMYGQEAGQANTVAQAANALQQFNTANRQTANLANQNTTQAANTYNTTNKQNIANENVTGKQKVQVQNQVEAPQEAAALALQKGAELSGIGQAQAGQQTGVGQQNAALFGGLLGAGANLGSAAIAAAEGGEIPSPTIPAINFVEGGPVPGHSQVPGDDKRNDTVPARLSPGEFVVPRSAMARPDIRSFLANNVPTPRPPAQAHPSDIASIMKALAMLRGGQEAA